MDKKHKYHHHDEYIHTHIFSSVTEIASSIDPNFECLSDAVTVARYFVDCEAFHLIILSHILSVYHYVCELGALKRHILDGRKTHTSFDFV